MGGTWEGSLGRALVVAVRAPAVEGRANESVRKVLAAALGVRARDLVVVQGEHGRDKLIELTSGPPGAAERLASLF